MVSMAVLALGIAAITILMTNSIKSSGDARDEMIAVGLANESIEIVRNFKENEPTFNSVTKVKSDGDYVVDVDSTFASFANNANKQLYIDSNKGFYVQKPGGNTATRFYRKVALTNGSGLISVTSYVSWNSSGSFSSCTIANKCVSVTSIMTDSE